MSALAKGTKKPKSSFGAPLDLFYLGRASLRFRRGSGLHLLTGYEVTRSHPGLRLRLPRLYAACHLAELLTGMTREEEPYPGLLDRICEALSELESARSETVPVLLFAAELELLGILGFAPSLHACASCAAAPGPGDALSASHGGILCRSCRERDERVISASPGVLSTLRILSRTPSRRAGRIRVSTADGRRIRAWLTAFEEWRLERPLRTSRFVAT